MSNLQDVSDAHRRINDAWKVRDDLLVELIDRQRDLITALRSPLDQVAIVVAEQRLARTRAAYDVACDAEREAFAAYLAVVDVNLAAMDSYNASLSEKKST